MKVQMAITLLAVILASCTSLVTHTPTETPIPTIAFTPVITTPISNSTFIPIPPTASPIPTEPTITVITPDSAQLERWGEYEIALATKLLDFALANGLVLCEWELLGQTNLEVYVYAYCMATVPVGEESSNLPAADVPAVIHLDVDGAIQSVEIPGAGTLYARDIRRMFPPDAQERIFHNLIDYKRLGDHLRWRIEHPGEPPLIVLSATPMP